MGIQTNKMKNTPQEIKSRILKYGLVEWKKCQWLQPEKLKKQSKQDSQKLRKSLIENGFASPLIVWEHGKILSILDGHHREKELKLLELEGCKIPEKLPAIWIDCKNEREARKLVAVYSSEYARMRPEAFFDFMSDFDPQEILSQISINGIDFLKSPSQLPEDIVPKPPKKTTVKTGEAWKLGDHVLICGDSSESKYISLAMRGAKSKLFATDPPYGVSLSDVKAGMAGFELNQVGKPIDNDKLDGPHLQGFLESVFRGCLPHLDKAAWYLWHAHLTQGFFAAAAAAADVLLHRQIIWVKPGLVFTRSGMYHWQHEPCFFGWVRGQQPAWYGKKNQTTFWQVGRDDVTGLHATQKPCELFAIPIRNHTKVGEHVLEPFAGSGSQVIAAEQLNRVCHAIEIEPRNCDVIIERWQNLTGKKAKRI